MDGTDMLHVDLDAFYASVEAGKDASLSGRPLVVGWPGRRGVVLSCSYEARAAGVRNGMPGMRARRLCPAAVFVPPDFDAYRAASGRFGEILRSFTPLVEPVSLDEAFCDVSHAHALFGTTPQIARRLRERVSSELGITCSVGAGQTKLVAKLASRRCKPDGALVVDDVESFLHPMAVGELWGVGESTSQACLRLGLRTVGDVASAPAGLLTRELGESAGAALKSMASGGDGRTVVLDTEARSVGAEQTFERDLTAPDRLLAEILRLSDRVASRLVASECLGRTVTLKIRLASFTTHTRSRTLPAPSCDVWTINHAARELFEAFRRREAVRLLGVSMSGLVRGPVPRQLSLHGGPRYEDAERAMTRVRERFGSDAVRLARLVGPSAED